jgi:hypothetical protein
MARNLKLAVPITTMELTNMIYSLSFTAPFENKLEYGVHPLLLPTFPENW